MRGHGPPVYRCDPAHTIQVVNRYKKWPMATEMPMVLLYASPGGISPPQVAEWLTERMKNLETIVIGQGLHCVQEDQPAAIRRGIADWHWRHFTR